MKIQHKNNGGLAEVSDEYGKALVATGAWLDVDGPKPAAPDRPKRRAQKPAPEPTEAPKAAIAE